MKIIARINSPFKEKFSIPRQPGLTSMESTVELIAPFNRKEALMGLENFSHLWVIFEFHQTSAVDESALVVRPPRLGGNTKQGVFATRSPFRPNNIGLSLVEIIRIEETSIVIKGGDFLDQTPVYDLKPYLKEIESIPDAKSSWADHQDKKLDVLFNCECNELLKNQINDVLSLDPRPRFHKDGYKTYGSKLFHYDIHWTVENERVVVNEIIDLQNTQYPSPLED